MQGVHPCDKRSSITKYQTLFPAIDFSLVSTTVANSWEWFMRYCRNGVLNHVCSRRLQIENDEDVLWEPYVREANESVAARGMKFIDW
jgi:hypothetical protein